MSYFVGLTFVQHYLQFKKINSFRRRFDYKHSPAMPLHMSILPPFELDNTGDLNELEDCLLDAVESNFLGLTNANEVEMSSLGFDYSKTSLLYLRPKLSEEIFFCQDSVKRVLKEFNVSFKKSKSIGKHIQNEFQSILPLGRLKDTDLFNVAVETAQEEFMLPFKLAAGSVVLFEKTSTGWVQRRRLFDFPKCELELASSNINVSGFQLS